MDNLPPNVYVKSATLGSSNILGDWFSIKQPSTINVVFSEKAGQIKGSVRSADQKVAVVLIPDDSSRIDLYRMTFPDARGSFELGSITPGSYRLFALDRSIGYRFFDRDYLSRMLPRGRKVLVEESTVLNSVLSDVLTDQ
jgi:hypothetical protein